MPVNGIQIDCGCIKKFEEYNFCTSEKFENKTPLNITCYNGTFGDSAYEELTVCSTVANGKERFAVK